MCIKKNDLSSHGRHRRNLKDILLNERSQSEKATNSMIPTKWYSGKGTATETKKRSWFPGVWGEGGREEWIDRAQGILRAMKLFCMIL